MSETLYLETVTEPCCCCCSCQDGTPATVDIYDSAGHGPRFRQLAALVGLVGPMKATTAGPDLAAHLATLCQSIGPYPHAELREGEAADRPKKQGTRMLRVSCPMCGYVVRTTAKWLEVGLPTCPCGIEMTTDETEEE